MEFCGDSTVFKLLCITMSQQSAHNYLALMLEENLDNSFDKDDLHLCNTSTIFDALNQMKVDSDPEANSTESNKLNELNIAAAPNQLQRIPTPPLTTVKK